MYISVVIPCLNEEKTLRACIEQAQLGLRALPHDGEVIVADNGSTDSSTTIAQNMGARVIPVSQRGYGSAIQGGIAHAQGTYVVIGDADGSYDFSVIPSFVNALEQRKSDLVIGNRFTGTIEDGAMPFMNRYIGNPVLTFIGRTLFGKVCGDFHCGLRAGRRDALLRLDLKCPGMEYATEMIIKAAKNGLKISEIPITLHKDGRDRAPHLRPWRDGCRHVWLMISYWVRSLLHNTNKQQ